MQRNLTSELIEALRNSNLRTAVKLIHEDNARLNDIPLTVNPLETWSEAQVKKFFDDAYLVDFMPKVVFKQIIEWMLLRKTQHNDDLGLETKYRITTNHLRAMIGEPFDGSFQEQDHFKARPLRYYSCLGLPINSAHLKTICKDLTVDNNAFEDGWDSVRDDFTGSFKLICTASTKASFSPNLTLGKGKLTLVQHLLLKSDYSLAVQLLSMNSNKEKAELPYTNATKLLRVIPTDLKKFDKGYIRKDNDLKQPAFIRNFSCDLMLDAKFQFSPRLLELSPFCNTSLQDACYALTLAAAEEKIEWIDFTMGISDNINFNLAVNTKLGDRLYAESKQLLIHWLVVRKQADLIIKHIHRASENINLDYEYTVGLKSSKLRNLIKKHFPEKADEIIALIKKCNEKLNANWQLPRSPTTFKDDNQLAARSVTKIDTSQLEKDKAIKFIKQLGSQFNVEVEVTIDKGNLSVRASGDKKVLKTFVHLLRENECFLKNSSYSADNKYFTVTVKENQFAAEAVKIERLIENQERAKKADVATVGALKTLNKDEERQFRDLSRQLFCDMPGLTLELASATERKFILKLPQHFCISGIDITDNALKQILLKRIAKELSKYTKVFTKENEWVIIVVESIPDVGNINFKDILLDLVKKQRNTNTSPQPAETSSPVILVTKEDLGCQFRDLIRKIINTPASLYQLQAGVLTEETYEISIPNDPHNKIRYESYIRNLKIAVRLIQDRFPGKIYLLENAQGIKLKSTLTLADFKLLNAQIAEMQKEHALVLRATPATPELCYSDHTYQHAALTLRNEKNSERIVNVVTWNLMNKCLNLEDNSKLGNKFSNNAWNITESFDKYIERKTRQLNLILSLIDKKTELDVFLLQEVDILMDTPKYIVGIDERKRFASVRDNFINELRKRNWDASVQAYQFGQKALVTLFNTKKLKFVTEEKLFKDGTGLATTFMHQDTPLTIANLHLNYAKNYTQEIREFKDKQRQKNCATLIGGDSNGSFNFTSSPMTYATNIYSTNNAIGTSLSYFDEKGKKKSYDGFELLVTPLGWTGQVEAKPSPSFHFDTTTNRIVTLTTTQGVMFQRKVDISPQEIIQNQVDKNRGCGI